MYNLFHSVINCLLKYRFRGEDNLFFLELLVLGISFMCIGLKWRVLLRDERPWMFIHCLFGSEQFLLHESNRILDARNGIFLAVAFWGLGVFLFVRGFGRGFHRPRILLILTVHKVIDPGIRVCRSFVSVHVWLMSQDLNCPFDLVLLFGFLKFLYEVLSRSQLLFRLLKVVLLVFIILHLLLLGKVSLFLLLFITDHLS